MTTNPYFLAFEALMGILLLMSFGHARRRGPQAVWELFAGILYGLALEWATLRQLQAYEYGQFLIMLGPVPVAIGVGWGTILYSVRLFTDSSNLPEWARPLLDGMQGLNIDLAMDAVAIRLGMWDWGGGFDFQYFGVPYANFWAWFWVIFGFSAGLRLSRRALVHLPVSVSAWMAPAGAILTGLGLVLGTNALITFVIPISWHGLSTALVLGCGLAILAWLRPVFARGTMIRSSIWVPSAFHSYFLLAGLISGALFQPPLLLLVSVVMALVALWLHLTSANQATSDESMSV